MPALTRSAAYTPLPAARLNAYANEIERLASGLFGNLTRTSRPVFKVERTSNLAIATGTDTTVTWQSEVNDPDNMWDPGVPKRININQAGDWLLICQERYLASTAGSRAGKIMVDGENVFANSVASAKSPAQNDGEGITMQIATFARLAQGQGLYVNTWQSSGANQDLIYKGHLITGTNFGFGGTWFAGLWLGP